MDKILILGAKGMLGSELSLAFAKYNPILWTRDDVDVCDARLVRKKILDLNPNFVINATAYTDVDKAEENKRLARAVNASAVEYIAGAARDIGATLVHYSTDYVFDGIKKQGYVETDKPSPKSVYGKSKLEGEQKIFYFARNGNLSYYIIRTAWLYGSHGKNFVQTMLRLAREKKQIKVVGDQFGSPTYAQDLAESTREIIESKKPFGIYHRTNSGQTSWYGFAKEIFSAFGINADLQACSSEEFLRPARRPQYSVLRSEKLPDLRSWKEALRAYAQFDSAQSNKL